MNLIQSFTEIAEGYCDMAASRPRSAGRYVTIWPMRNLWLGIVSISELREDPERYIGP
jgi:hypothetical protein